MSPKRNAAPAAAEEATVLTVTAISVYTATALEMGRMIGAAALTVVIHATAASAAATAATVATTATVADAASTPKYTRLSVSACAAAATY